MPGTISDRQWVNTCNKGVPGLMSELSTQFFNIHVDDNGDKPIDIGEWTSLNGRLVRADTQEARESSAKLVQLHTAEEIMNVLISREL